MSKKQKGFSLNIYFKKRSPMYEEHRDCDFFKRYVWRVYHESTMFTNTTLLYYVCVKLPSAIKTLVIWWENPSRHQTCLTMSRGLLYVLADYTRLGFHFLTRSKERARPLRKDPDGTLQQKLRKEFREIPKEHASSLEVDCLLCVFLTVYTSAWWL